MSRLGHHARVCYGQPATLADFGFVNDGSSEVRQYVYEQFTIEDSRKLILEASRRPSGKASKLVFFLRIETIVMESQHALLKLLEEPPESTSFLFSFLDEQQLLPTVRSRLQSVKPASNDVAVDPPEIFEIDLPEALKLIERKLKQVDHVWLQAERHRLLMWLRDNSDTQPPCVASTLMRSITRIGTRGAVNKWLFESVVTIAHPALR